MSLPKSALILTASIGAASLVAIGYALSHMQGFDAYRFPVLLALTMLTARLKVKLPGLTGNMAVNLPFVLIAISELSLLEALLVALPACAVQSLPSSGKPKLVQVIFNLSTSGVAVALASLIGKRFALFGVAGYFLAQTVPVASIIQLTEGGRLHRIWGSIAHYSFPFYVLSAGLTSMAISSTTQFAWQVPLLGLPVLYAIYRSYDSYFQMPFVRPT